MLFVDIETTDEGLYCIGHGLGASPIRVDEKLEPDVVARLADPGELIITQSTYDLRHIRLFEGVDVRARLHDTKVMAWLVNENTPLDLDFIAFRYCGLKMDKRLSRSGRYFRQDDGQVLPMRLANRKEVHDYCGRDVAALRDVYVSLADRLRQEGLWEHFETVAAPFTQVLLDMECRGMPIDVAAAEALALLYRKRREELERDLKTGLPSAFNIRSNPQLRDYITTTKFLVRDRRPIPDKETAQALRALEKLADEPAKTEAELLADANPGEFIATKAGRLFEHGFWCVPGRNLHHPAASVAVPSLRLNKATATDPWVQKLFEFKKLDKLLGTYVEKFPRVAVDGRVYGRFNQTGTVTGRLSSSDPNLQNIPSRGQYGDEVRDLFRGNLVVGDFSQLEPRLMAHFSKDPILRSIYASGRDLYQETGNMVMRGGDPSDNRQIAKVLVLAMGYGAGAQKLADILSLNGFPTSTSQASEFLRRLKAVYHVYFEWREHVIARAGLEGHVLTLDGRKRRIEQPSYREGGWGAWKGHSERQAANAIIQGSAADIVTRVMLHCSKMFPDLRMLAQVHDEIVWEYDISSPPDLRRIETKVVELAQRGVSVPIVFEPHFGKSWEEAKAGTGSLPVLLEEDDDEA